MPEYASNNAGAGHLMLRFGIAIYCSAIAALLCGAFSAHGADYPLRPIRVLTSETGGGGDFASRVVAQGLTAVLMQQVIVDNRTILAADIVAKATSDGYTLLSY